MFRPAWILLPLAVVLIPLPACAQSLFDAPALADADLAGQRAGFELPGGIQVALAVQITTDVNGERLLQTVWQVNSMGSFAAARTPVGTIAVQNFRNASFKAELPGFQVENFIGQRIGSIVINSGDGRTVDQQVSVDLTLSNVQLFSIGSALFRVQSPALEAGMLRASGG